MNFPLPEKYNSLNQVPQYMAVPGYNFEIAIQIADKEDLIIINKYICRGYSLNTAIEMAISEKERRQNPFWIRSIGDNRAGLTDHQNRMMRDWISLHAQGIAVDLNIGKSGIIRYHTPTEETPKVNHEKGTVEISITNDKFYPQPVMLFNSMSRLTVPLSKNITTVFRFHAKPENKFKAFFKKLFRL